MYKTKISADQTDPRTALVQWQTELVRPTATADLVRQYIGFCDYWLVRLALENQHTTLTALINDIRSFANSPSLHQTSTLLKRHAQLFFHQTFDTKSLPDELGNLRQILMNKTTGFFSSISEIKFAELDPYCTNHKSDFAKTSQGQSLLFCITTEIWNILIIDQQYPAVGAFAFSKTPNPKATYYGNQIAPIKKHYQTNFPTIFNAMSKLFAKLGKETDYYQCRGRIYNALGIADVSEYVSLGYPPAEVTHAASASGIN